MNGKLIIVGTPIGNLGDFSERGKAALNDCDFIAAEDTRVTSKLLFKFEIKKPMISYFEHNKFQHDTLITDRIEKGETCALVTDAGMPVISDPGQELIQLCREKNIEIDVVPGPTAFATALALSGMPSKNFVFEGFLSADRQEKRKRLSKLKNEERTMIFYEAPHKLIDTIEELKNAFGEDRNAAVVKELTKIHQKCINNTLGELSDIYKTVQPKGEYVLIVEGKEIQDNTASFEDAAAFAKELCENGMSINNASKLSSKYTGIKKGDIYKYLNDNK